MTAARLPPPEEPQGSDWKHPAHVGFEALIEKGPVMIAAATCFTGVAPSRFQASPHIMLRFGHQLSPPIYDFAWDSTGIVGTLTFGGEEFKCRIPWLAVVAMKPDSPSVPEPPVKPRSGLRLVP